jgi:hypothetical protein
MSFGNVFKMSSRVQEVFFLALIVMMVIALSMDISLTYKIGIGVLVFSIIFLTTSAIQVLKDQKENRQS